MKKALNLKNMKETMVNFSGTTEEMEKIWETFYEMVKMDFIDRDLWIKFYNQCKGWYITGDEVRDMDHDDKLIWKYTADDTYRA